MRESQAVIVHADDPVALIDIPAMAAARGWQCRVEQSAVSMRFVLSADLIL